MLNLIIAAILLLVSTLATASPTRIITEYSVEFPPLCFGYGRVNFAMPQGADILALEIDQPARYASAYRPRSGSVTVHVAIDPDAPIIWRAIDISVGEQPLTMPVDRHLGFWRIKGQAVHAFDKGDFVQPVPGCES